MDNQNTSAAAGAGPNAPVEAIAGLNDPAPDAPLAGDPLNDVKAQLETALSENDMLNTRAEAAEKALAKMTAERDALQAKADKAAAAAKATKVAAPKMRKVVAMDRVGAVELLAAIGEAETSVELVFSDGKREIDGLPALRIEGDAWAHAVNGLKLDVPIEVDGPATGSTPYQLAGYGLLVDGKQVGWAPRTDVLQIAGGQHVRLTGDVIFSA